MPAQDVSVSSRRRRVSLCSVVILDKLHHVPESHSHPRRPVHDARTSVSVPSFGIRPQTNHSQGPPNRPTAYQPITLRRQTGSSIIIIIVFQKTIKIVSVKTLLKCSPNSIIFGTKVAKTIELCKAHRHSTSPNLRQRTTV